MDMDVMAESEGSEAPTRVATPAEARLGGVFEEESQAGEYTVNGAGLTASADTKKEVIQSEPEPEQPKKMGNLMKELKQDVQQGAMEFNMDNFF